MLQVIDLTKHYQEGNSRRQLYSDVNFTISAGETVSLVGASGSGKSTLLHLIAGLDRPTKGKILFENSELTALSERQRTAWRRRQVGMVFQFFNLIPSLTVAENLQLPLQLNGLKDDGDVASLLNAVGLSNRSRAFPEQLSGGEQQRLAIARALVHRPALLLADEPTGSLDEENGDNVLRLLAQLCRTQGAALLLVTHSPTLAAQTDRQLQLCHGTVREIVSTTASTKNPLRSESTSAP